MKIRIQRLLVGIAVISLMTFFFIKTNSIDSVTHNQFSQRLRRLKEFDATLDKNILESRFGLLTSYDLLQTQTAEIDRLTDELNVAPAFLGARERAELRALTDEFTQLQQEKIALIERFKSRNAVLNNSLRYFPLAASNVITNSAASGEGVKHIGPLNDLVRTTLTYYLLKGTDLEADITARMDQLESAENKQGQSASDLELRNAISHARTIVRLKPVLDDLVHQIVSKPTGSKIEQVIALYDTDYENAMSWSNRYRLLLYIFSILMIGYIAFIVVKLRKATMAVRSANESLEKRVEERTEELSRSHDELQKSEANTQALINAIPDSMWKIDKNGKILYLIAAKDENSPFAAFEWQGKTVFDILPRDVADRTLHLAERSLITGSIQVFEYQLNDNDSIKHFEGRAIACGDSEILTIVRDITEQKTLEAKLQRGQKLEAIGQLAAGIAHEINTPTQYVGDNVRFLQSSFEDIGYVLKRYEEFVGSDAASCLDADLLNEMRSVYDKADVEFLNDEVPKAFDETIRGIERISKIVQSMKDFAHPGSVEMKSIDLNKSIESTITIASNEWKYVADIVTNYDPNLPPVPCFAGEFNQVVLNMIVNASHAIADIVGDGSCGKGTINISTRLKGEFAEIRISDTGGGIPENIREKIFEPFFTTKEVGKGTGQGLAISHAVIVEKHKGTIAVQSEPGNGSAFIIELPLHAEASVY